jgi:hypothetical protein
MALTSAGPHRRPANKQHESLTRFPPTRGKQGPCRDVGVGEIAPGFARPSWQSALHTLVHQRHLTPSCGRPVLTHGENHGPGKDAHRELDLRPGIRERPRSRAALACGPIKVCFSLVICPPLLCDAIPTSRNGVPGASPESHPTAPARSLQTVFSGPLGLAVELDGAIYVASYSRDNTVPVWRLGWSPFRRCWSSCPLSAGSWQPSFNRPAPRATSANRVASQRPPECNSWIVRFW